jgi:hypothetical protein
MEEIVNDQEKDIELGMHAEKLISHIESELQYDEEGKSYLMKKSILNIIFRVTDFMKHLSKRL